MVSPVNSYFWFTPYPLSCAMPAHCSAMAFAMPWNVLDRVFASPNSPLKPPYLPSSVNDWFTHPRPGFLRIFVALSGRIPLSQIQVVFSYGCPNCHGWIICDGLIGNPYFLSRSGNHFRMYLPLMIPTGFSIAIRSQSALTICIKNLIAACCRPSDRFAAKCLAPLAAKCVHGGKAMIMSHLPSI